MTLRLGRHGAGPKIGDPAPDFELEATGGRDLPALVDYRGEWVILAFYPGDFTPVCTRQFCSYRDAADRLDDLDAIVLGISPQSVDSHERFAAEHDLTVPLLADPDQRPRAPTASSRPAASSAARSSSSIPRAWSATATSRCSASATRTSSTSPAPLAARP